MLTACTKIPTYYFLKIKNIHFTEKFQARKTAPYSWKLKHFLYVKVKEKNI